ncbi:uncharacterized protein LOC120388761 isoform X2 [Mauremys reevesii]|uniref:uncharacterized protein LOC120388761 isoform X2 n=1 Tax=Mauremys reevesii TaxID=260615 RepID=UPI00193F445E|nr:uncharacterized protein LOC120388761 isoform X2 [Mauremys reevesii]
MPPWNCQTVGLSRLVPMILLLGLWLLCSLAASQEMCSSPGSLPAPRLFLDRLSARQGDTALLSCLVPVDAPMTRIVFCKDGKEISVQPKGGNTLVYDSPYTVSRESAGAFSCRYQLKDDNNQENNSLPSDLWYLHVAGDDGSGGGTSPQGKRAIVGLALTTSLALALLGCFLMRTVVSRCRTHRDPGPDRSSPDSGDQIQYTVVTGARADQPRLDGDVAVTYAVVGKGSSRGRDTRTAP